MNKKPCEECIIYPQCYNRHLYERVVRCIKYQNYLIDSAFEFTPLNNNVFIPYYIENKNDIVELMITRNISLTLQLVQEKVSIRCTMFKDIRKYGGAFCIFEGLFSQRIIHKRGDKNNVFNI